MSWFRMYDEVLNDPKVQKLSPELFKSWVNLLCLASKHDGNLPPIEDVSFALRMDKKKAEKHIRELIKLGLIDEGDCGFSPHNWDERQFKSDVSTERVKAFRERKRNVSSAVSETPPETEQRQSRTETEQSRAETRDYSFAGNVIRLKPLDYDRWKKTYHAIPDFNAKLQALDDWFHGSDPSGKDWFRRVSSMLAKDHAAALEQRKARGDPKKPSAATLTRESPRIQA